MNDESVRLIEAAKKMTIGTDYKVAQKSVIYTDERTGMPRKDLFWAVEFTAQDGAHKFVGAMFL